MGQKQPEEASGKITKSHAKRKIEFGGERRRL
jgi:hypothetical protein